MPRKRDPHNTVGGVLITQLGFRRATVVGGFISLWSLYRAVEGHDPATVEEFADAIERDKSSVYRWLADFREVFPQWRDPGALLDAAQVESGLHARGVMKLAVA